MWLRKAGLGLLVVCCLLVSGCGYAKEITRREQPGIAEPSPESERFGSIRLHWVQEYREPTGWRTFPDGGTPLDLAYYAILYQSGPGVEEREIGRIELKPVRPNDFGDLINRRKEWRAPDRYWTEVLYGYDGDNRTIEVEITLPPLH